MSASRKADNTQQARPNGRDTKPRAGGLLSSGFIENRKNPVLTEDIFLEPIRANGVIKLAGDFVRFFDDSDSLLHTISAVYNASPTTRSIIRAKSTLIMGDGFNLMKGRPNTLFPALAKGAEPMTDPKIIEALDDRLMAVNAEGETLAEVSDKVVQEFNVYGNAYVSLSKPAGGRDLFCHHIPFVKGRLSEIKKDSDEPQVLGINEEWKERTWSDANVVKIPLYPNWSEPDENGVQRTAIHLKDHAPGFEYYGLPEWIASLMYAEIEYRIAKFNSSKFDNAFLPSGVLQFFGAASTEEAKQIVKDAKNKYTGTGKNGGLFIQVLRDEALKAHFTKMEGDSEGEFLDLSKVSAQAIVSAHRWTMSLAGFATSGKLGSNEQIRREFEIVQNTVIKPLQNMICRRFLNVYMKELALMDTGLKGLYLDIQNSTPVSFIGDVDINQVLTNDEKREVAGYSPVEKESNEITSLRDTVNSFSPLVVNKMIESLEADEIRLLLGFQPSDNGSNNNTDTDTAGRSGERGDIEGDPA